MKGKYKQIKKKLVLRTKNRTCNFLLIRRLSETRLH